MAFVSRRSLVVIAILALAALLASYAAIWSGFYNVAADDPHTRPLYVLLETVRDRSIARRAAELQVPDLSARERITQGAGNYNAMCTGCHLLPGAEPTELSKGLYPAPPNLTLDQVDAARAFWVIKHGIKASGMPAWGKSMDDEYIWNMVAFLQVLPTLDSDGYHTMVAASGGHAHGGGETDGHAHAQPEPDPTDSGSGPPDHHATEPEVADHHAAMPAASPTAGTEHVHADGARHVHEPAPASPAPPATAPPAARPAPPPADDHDAHSGHAEAERTPAVEPPAATEAEPEAEDHSNHDHHH